MKYFFAIGILFCCMNLFSQEIPENLTDVEKIYGLSKVWKEADKNFVFFDQVPNLNWDSTYQLFIPKVLETSTTYEYYKVLQRFCSLLNDGHTRVYVPRPLRKIHEFPPPVWAELINGKVFINEIQNDTVKRQGISVGMEIIEIDGVNVHDFANKHIKPYVFYSTPQDMNVIVYERNLLKGHINKPLKLKMRSGKEFIIKRNMSRTVKKHPIFEFKIMDDNVGYLKIRRFYGDNIESEFDSIYKEIKKTSKLIIDVSTNQGGNSGHAHYVLSHFVNKPFQTSNWKTPKYMPAYASWGRGLEWDDNKGYMVKPVKKSNRYGNKIILLISEKTYSAGEDFVSAFLNTKRGTVIGRPTAGSTGNPIGFPLPGKGSFQICSKRDYLSTGKEFVGYGIAPDHVISKTKDKNQLINEALKRLKK